MGWSLDNVRPVSLYKTVIIFVIAILGILFIYNILNILIVFILSFLLAYALHPVISLMNVRLKVPRGIIVVMVLIVFVALLSLLLYYLIPAIIGQINSFIGNTPQYLRTLQKFWSGLVESNPYLKRDFDFSSLSSQLGQRLSDTLQPLVIAISSVFSFLLEFVLVLVIAFFSLTSPHKIRDAAIEVVPPKYREKVIDVGRKISVKIGGYLKGIIFSGVIVGLISYIGYAVLGVNFALTLGIVAGILELVPIIGPIIAGGAAVIVALFQEPILAFYVMIFAVLVQQFENHILVPNLMSKQVGLHPVTVIFVTLVMAKFLGIVGIFLAVPLAAIVKILIEELYIPAIEETKA